MEEQLAEARKRHVLDKAIDESDSDSGKDDLEEQREEILTLNTELERQKKSIDEMTADITAKTVKEVAEAAE